MQLADTNIILRYVLNDNEELSILAKSIIESGVVEARIEVIAEAVYVLKSVYQVTQRDVCLTMTAFIEKSGIVVEDKPLLVKALEYYGTKNLGFIDCILTACAANNGDQVHTFDQKLRKTIDKSTKKNQ
jgi:predicted nucleic-acid-binding protein